LPILTAGNAMATFECQMLNWCITAHSESGPQNASKSHINIEKCLVIINPDPGPSKNRHL